MTTLKRLRSQLDPYEITPNNSDDEDDVSPANNNNSNNNNNNNSEAEDDLSSIQSTTHNGDEDDTDALLRTPGSEEPFDVYAPLTPEEADEDQLAEFFTTLDVDASLFGALLPPPPPLSFDLDEIVVRDHAESETTRGEQSPKRRRLFYSDATTSDDADGDNETDKENENDKELRRKQQQQQQQQRAARQ
eukprot:jgi/Psemu1/303576/fgenesh1_kg.112_\